ncbi:MAG TPA: BatD family protein [candidate division Zixibacteria bacterium]|nr:BatD family protein [candidate division Zixibacteria bacterium]
MIKRFLIYLVLLSVLSTLALAAADDVQVEVKLNRTSIGMDEQAILEIKVTGASQNLPEPQLPTLPAFEVYSQGRSSNYSWVNGEVESSMTYRYLLLPQKPGTYPIEPISVVYNNHRYKGNQVELTVVSQGAVPTQQDTEERATDQSGRSRDYFFEAVVDNKNPYVNEQVLLTLKFYTAVQHYGSLELTNPTTTGFWTEDVGSNPPYYQRINDRRYQVIEKMYALFPTQTGELTIGRAMITTTIASRDRNRRDPFNAFGDFFGRGQEVTVRSQPITINVKPLPSEGRPPEFTGTIGKFDMRTKVDKREVDVNQPVTLTISISGTGNIKSVSEPVIPELDDFRVYRASANEKVATANNKVGGSKVFEEVFIPRRPGNLEIPGIDFAYFDPEAGRFKSVSTDPIRLNVTRPEGYVESADVPYGSPGMTIGAEAKDIRHIKSDPGNLSKSSRLILFEPVYVVVNGLPVLALIGIVAVCRRRHKLSADTGYARSRAAARVAKKRLQKARSLAAVDTSKEFYTEIYSALVSYIADKLNISPHGLTSDKVAELLREQQADEGLIEQILDVMKRCDFARYAAAAVDKADIDGSLDKVEKIMIRIEEVRFA